MPPELRLTKPGITRAELDVSWKDRLSEAESLLAAKHFASSISASLYALEIYLKVRICKKLDLESLPRAFETHDLEGLLVLTGLSRRLNSKKLIRSGLRRNWEGIRTMSERLNDLRYRPAQLWKQSDAEKSLSRLKDPEDGVLTWLFKQR